MLDLLKEVILDFQETEPFTGVPRRTEVITVSGKAAVCIGPRRSGKSTFLFQLVRKILDGGARRDDILYLNFFDDRLRQLRRDGLAVILEAYFSLFPEKKNARKIYCFFDEIHVVPDWESFVDRLMRTEKCEVYVTGSSARLLSREIATQMRGRALSWEIFPFSFREFLDFEGIDGGGRLSAQRRLLVRGAFDRFWEAGGFPEVAGLAPALRIRVHQEYWGTMLFRDLIERHDVSHPRAVSDLAHRLADNVASLRQPADGIPQVARSPCAEIGGFRLSALVGGRLLHVQRVIFDPSRTRANANPKKIYCVDHSLVRSVSSGILVNAGHLLENLVFTALRRVTSRIFYYRSAAGREVDFLALLPDGSRILVQVCESLADPQTLRRETAALRDAMAELDQRTSLIVTRDVAPGAENRIAVDSGSIEIVVAWRFLLDLDQAHPV